MRTTLSLVGPLKVIWSNSFLNALIYYAPAKWYFSLSPKKIPLVRIRSEVIIRKL